MKRERESDCLAFAKEWGEPRVFLAGQDVNKIKAMELAAFVREQQILALEEFAQRCCNEARGRDFEGIVDEDWLQPLTERERICDELLRSMDALGGPCDGTVSHRDVMNIIRSVRDAK